MWYTVALMRAPSRFLVALAVCALAARVADAATPGPAWGTHGMVVTSVGPAAEAGREILGKGGNAVDAADCDGVRGGRRTPVQLGARRRRVRGRVHGGVGRSRGARRARDGARQRDHRELSRRRGQGHSRHVADRPARDRGAVARAGPLGSAPEVRVAGVEGAREAGDPAVPRRRRGRPRAPAHAAARRAAARELPRDRADPARQRQDPAARLEAQAARPREDPRAGRREGRQRALTGRDRPLDRDGERRSAVARRPRELPRDLAHSDSRRVPRHPARLDAAAELGRRAAGRDAERARRPTTCRSWGSTRARRSTWSRAR